MDGDYNSTDALYLTIEVLKVIVGQEKINLLLF